jgi:hypothetical protein
MLKQLSTVEEVISELGGFDAVKTLTNSQSPSVVPTWKYRKQFPPRTYPALQTALKKRGLTAPNKLWGIP